MVSQKCQYALRAILELAKHYHQGPVKIGDIAKAQDIPPHFLAVILGELKQGGFVESRRGNDGGYLLLRAPRSLSVGEVMRFVEGPLEPVSCFEGGTGNRCRLYVDCVFRPMWRRAEAALSEVYDGTMFADLVEQDARMRREEAYSYAI